MRIPGEFVQPRWFYLPKADKGVHDLLKKKKNKKNTNTHLRGGEGAGKIFENVYYQPCLNSSLKGLKINGVKFLRRFICKRQLTFG